MVLAVVEPGVIGFRFRLPGLSAAILYAEALFVIIEDQRRPRRQVSLREQRIDHGNSARL